MNPRPASTGKALRYDKRRASRIEITSGNLTQNRRRNAVRFDRHPEVSLSAIAPIAAGLCRL
ncbi:hypothetical protein CCR78_05920 [Rhodovulum imhoffii]|nr:hypothetical protein [Rhodovulum imhoffii]